MLAIKNNLMAAGAARNLSKSYDMLGTSVQRLSSGLRINSAKDDAAGLAVRELIRADVASLQQGSRNAMDGVSMLQAAEGALGEIDAILVRMRELCEQASTDTYSVTQKSIMQAEFDELALEINRIADTTDFNDINLLNSSSGSVKISLGSGVADSNKTISVGKSDLTAEALGLSGKAETSVFSSTNAAAMAASDSGAYITNATTATVAVSTVSITFGGETASFTIASGATMTLDEVVTEINNDLTGATASAVDNGSGSYVLQITMDTIGTQTDITVSTAGSAITWGTGSTGIAAAHAATTQGTNNPDLTDGLDTATNLVVAAIETKDSFRASLGYYMNRLEYASSVLDVQAENLLAAESRISDVDVATEMSDMTRNQVLSQAGISMLAQANSMPQMALTLLQQ